MLREDYNTVEGTELNPIEWDDHQDPSLDAVTRTVELHTKWWYNRKFRQLQSRKVYLTYEKMKPEEEIPAESIGQQGGGNSQEQHQAVKNKKRGLEVEKDKEHQEPSAKKQSKVPSRESIIEARSQEVGISEQRAAVEVSSGSESSGYSNSTGYSPLSENQVEEDMAVSNEGGKPIDIEALSAEEGSQAPKAVGDAMLVEPNPVSGRCIAPLWLRQMLMPRKEVVAIRIVEDIQGLVEKEDDVRQKQIAGTVAKVIRNDEDGHRKVQIAVPKLSKAVDEIVAQDYEIVEHDMGRITDDMECVEVQEGIASIRERLRKANERVAELEIESKYWRDSYHEVHRPI